MALNNKRARFLVLVLGNVIPHNRAHPGLTVGVVNGHVRSQCGRKTRCGPSGPLSAARGAGSVDFENTGHIERLSERVPLTVSGRTENLARDGDFGLFSCRGKGRL